MNPHWDYNGSHMVVATGWDTGGSLFDFVGPQYFTHTGKNPNYCACVSIPMGILTNVGGLGGVKESGGVALTIVLGVGRDKKSFTLEPQFSF